MLERTEKLKILTALIYSRPNHFPDQLINEMENIWNCFNVSLERKSREHFNLSEKTIATLNENGNIEIDKNFELE